MATVLQERRVVMRRPTKRKEQRGDDRPMDKLITVVLAFLTCIPSALTGVIVWRWERRMEKRQKERDKKEEAREKNELLNTQATWAAVALAEATARAVQRIPDAKCNGDMHAALDYAAKVKHDQKEFLAKQGIHALYD